MSVVRAPAKLTRSLRITGVRADGFHLLDAEMITLEVADGVRLKVQKFQVSALMPKGTLKSA